MLVRYLVSLALTAFASIACGEDLHALMARCVPEVHPTTMAAIVRVESTGNMFVLSDDGPGNLPLSERRAYFRSIYPSSLEEAAQITKGLIAQGHWVGIGLTQLSNRHLKRMGLSVEQALDPCTNLKGGGQVLMEYYTSAQKRFGNTQEALHAAISAYNSGNFESGIANGYVAKVIKAAGFAVPELKAGTIARSSSPRAAIVRASAAASAPAQPSRLQARFAKLEAENF